ncbi:hypothetical protein I5907_21290 [Panacibacter sp. DH6]|uniref:HEPN domain-containing protein n=1 Tax=Panacibacter microcysteis TaxID=2793269 RepID=A0A931H0K9_9BACT|nr:hypothetical protein [Panacibacter microcysteis]MBG9378781.1 hypothetical protein [Panacibacter microcysteis]
MTSPAEIIKLAWQRLDEAEVLINNNKCDGAFYLAGYSVELMLKAKICERLGIPNLFNDGDRNLNLIQGISEVRKAVKTHNLFILLIFSGLKLDFDNEKASNILLARTNSLLFTAWDENARYKPCGHFKATDVQKLITLLKDPKGILKWIETN